jgi:hypothetical protein
LIDRFQWQPFLAEETGGGIGLHSQLNLAICCAADVNIVVWYH